MEQASFFEDQHETPPETGPTRATGLSRLEAFAPRAGRAYAGTRNTDTGPGARRNVSVLSPYLRHRLVLEEEVLRATLARHSLSAAEKFVQEVYWRAYFKGWLQNRPGVWARYRRDVAAGRERLETEGGLRKAYDQAVAGATGIDCFDAWARELTETGYLHNHARMWFASVWIFTLRLPWALGADFFYRRLLDGDPASNTLSWRWVAGLHTKGKNYLARASNIERYTQGRFNPVGQLNEAAEALEEPAFDDGPKAALPEPDATLRGPVGLLVTEEDCAPEIDLLTDVDFASVAGLSCAEARSPEGVSADVVAFTRGAVGDALSRAGEGEARIFSAGDLEAVADWAGERGLKTLATAFAPAGPARETLDGLKPLLGARGISLIERARPYDRAAWPHAKKGFFGLKKKIPQLLEEAGLV